MKILAAGDIHGDRGLALRLARKARDEKVDLVVLCGDLTESELQTDHIVGPFVKYNENVVIIPGNHDSIPTIDFLSKVYGAKNLHGYSLTLQGVGFFGCGGANIGPETMMQEDEIFETVEKAHSGVKDAAMRVLVGHVHPSGGDIEKFTQFFPGSTGMRKAIEVFKPDIALCSHVHEAQGIEEKIGPTTVINVGKEGKIIEINAPASQ